MEGKIIKAFEKKTIEPNDFPHNLLKPVAEPESEPERESESEPKWSIFIPNQKLKKLPITLAQLKAENNSENYENEIRKLLFSLFCSKKLTEAIYKHLIDIIWI